MTEFNFYLMDDDTERLFALKAAQGADDLTGNEFAKQLLSETLRRLHPSNPRTERQED